ncbi:thyroid transcription factor 1-associated protein 26-like [Dreissena polymorpha]|uniref:Thyroid transcription factor 1-associated protein 26 n=1 Tax=Dreissena polymorpha TaxID=45954 RepID=A0A9D4RXT8_DREPO|nr:thyroid transcription factor 1-associated protein 26-like [Dreissena polymorpha]KAH3882572.1 hypothetical protein DPMN_006513 [Dreissena polymorpha]
MERQRKVATNKMEQVKQSVKRRHQDNDRFKKFIGNKSEGQGFADKRKKKIQYQYMKMMQKEQKKARATGQGPETSQRMLPFRRHGIEDQKSLSVFSRALQESQLRKQRKEQKKQAFLERKQKREEAQAVYQKKKKETFKKICKRTSRGQPVMKNQIEYLLQKIERQREQT